MICPEIGDKISYRAVEGRRVLVVDGVCGKLFHAKGEALNVSRDTRYITARTGHVEGVDPVYYDSPAHRWGSVDLSKVVPGERQQEVLYVAAKLGHTLKSCFSDPKQLKAAIEVLLCLREVRQVIGALASQQTAWDYNIEILREIEVAALWNDNEQKQ